MNKHVLRCGPYLVLRQHGNTAMKQHPLFAILFAGVMLFALSSTLHAENIFKKLGESSRRATENAKRSWEQSRPQREEAARRLQESARRVTEDAKRSWEQSRPQREEATRRLQESARRATEDAKRSWEQSRPQREEATRRFQESTRRAAENVRSSWEESQTKREQVANNMRELMLAANIKARQKWENTQAQRQGIARELSARCEAGREAREKFVHDVSERAALVINQYGQQAEQAIQQAARTYGPRVALVLTQTYEKHGATFGNTLATAFEQHAPVIEAAVHDPQDAEQVMCAVIAVVNMRQAWDQSKKQVTYEALRAVGEIEVDGPTGRTTLSDLSRRWMTESVPGLAGTSIANDPAEFVTYGLVYQDKDYLFREMKIIDAKKTGGKISMQTALLEASLIDPSDVESVLAVMATCEALSSGAVSGEDVVVSADAFRCSLDLYAKHTGE